MASRPRKRSVARSAVDAPRTYCELCRVRPQNMGNHVPTTAHRLAVHVAAMHARGWTRVTSWGWVLSGSVAPMEHAPSSIQPYHGREGAFGDDRDFTVAFWAPRWAVRLASLGGVDTDAGTHERRHWILRCSLDEEFSAHLDAVWETVTRLRGKKGMVGMLRSMCGGPGEAGHPWLC